MTSEAPDSETFVVKDEKPSKSGTFGFAASSIFFNKSKKPEKAVPSGTESPSLLSLQYSPSPQQEQEKKSMGRN